MSSSEVCWQIGSSETTLILKQSDITKEETEAIVNAANSSLMGGGGVDGAIHRAGGPSILNECKEIIATSGPCSTGNAVITGGGALRAKAVIHTVGPRWSGGSRDEAKLLALAYKSCLTLALEYRLLTLAFPSISTGAYGFPIEHAAPIALRTVLTIAEEACFFEQIRFVLFSAEDLDTYRTALASVSEYQE